MDLDNKGAMVAVDQAVRNGPQAPVAEAEQAPLPGLAEALVSDDAGAVEVRRGRGRPAGSRNKATEAWTSFLLTQYGSPLEALLSVATMSPSELAQKLNLWAVEASMARPSDIMEVFKIQLTAAAAALPYLHQKQPQAVELGDGGGLISLTLNLSPEAAALAQAAGTPVEGGDGRVTLEIQALDLETAENSEIIDNDDA